MSLCVVFLRFSWNGAFCVGFVGFVVFFFVRVRRIRELVKGRIVLFCDLMLCNVRFYF